MSIGDRLLKAGLALVLMLLVSLPMGIAATILMMGRGIPSVLIPVLWVMEIAIVGLLLWFGKSQRLITLDKIWWSVTAWSTAILACLAMSSFSLIGSLLIEQMGQVTTANQQLIEQITTQLPVGLTFLAVVIGAPLGEELVCRGLFPDVFSGPFLPVGYLVGTLIFALAHSPTNLGSWVIYGGMGLVLAAVRYISNRLEYAILAHGLNNLIAFVLMMIGD